MLDGADAGADRVLDAVGALGVGHHEDARGRGLGHQHLQLVGPEVGMTRIVARREHAARRGHLDDVGAGPDELAHLEPHLVRAHRRWPEGRPGWGMKQIELVARR